MNPVAKKLLIIILIFSVFGGVFAVAPNVNALGPDPCGHTKTNEERLDCLKALAIERENESGFFDTLTPEYWMTRLLQGIMWVSSWLLYIAGATFNYVIEVALNIGNKEGLLSVVNFGWTLLRDIANILFIFIILYIGISTILNLSGGSTKKLLIKVVLMALLVNFSLFFTKVIVDVSNILAIGFYNAIVDEAQTRADAGAFGGSGATIFTADAGLSELFMDKLRLTTLYADSETGETKVVTDFRAESNFVYIMGTFLILTTTFVLLAGAFLFALRTIIIVFLMMLAPLAYVGYMLPATAKYAKEWWDKLLAQAFFAPIYMILIFISIKGLDQLNVIPLEDTPETLAGVASSFGTSLTSIHSNGAAIFFNFALVIGMMVGALVIAKKIGVAGADTSVTLGGNLRKWGQGVVGRNALGRPSAAIDRLAQRGQESLEEKGTTGRFAAATLGGLRSISTQAGAEAKFGSKQSRVDVIKAQEGAAEKGAKERAKDPEKAAAYIASLPASRQGKAYQALSQRDRGAVEEALGDANKKLIETLRKGLSVEEREKTDEAKTKAGIAAKNRRLRALIKKMAERNATGLAQGETVGEGDEAFVTETAYTLSNVMKQLPKTEGRKLHQTAIDNTFVIRELRPHHLADLMQNGHLNQKQIERIRSEIEQGSHTNQPRQWAYISSPVQKDLWGV